MTKAFMGEAYVTGVIKLLDSSEASGPKISLPVKKKRESAASPRSVSSSLPEARVILEPPFSTAEENSRDFLRVSQPSWRWASMRVLIGWREGKTNLIAEIMWPGLHHSDPSSTLVS